MSDCCNLSYRFQMRFLEFKIIMNIIMIVQYLTTRKVKKDIPIPNQSLLISKSLSALCVLCALSLCVCLLCSVTNFANFPNFPLVLHTGFGGYMNTLSLSLLCCCCMWRAKKRKRLYVGSHTRIRRYFYSCMWMHR